jgi:hypothetical protein
VDGPWSHGYEASGSWDRKIPDLERSALREVRDLTIADYDACLARKFQAAKRHEISGLAGIRFTSRFQTLPVHTEGMKYAG